jgi:hypothetical protein
MCDRVEHAGDRIKTLKSVVLAKLYKFGTAWFSFDNTNDNTDKIYIIDSILSTQFLLWNCFLYLWSLQVVNSFLTFWLISCSDLQRKVRYSPNKRCEQFRQVLAAYYSLVMEPTWECGIGYLNRPCTSNGRHLLCTPINCFSSFSIFLFVIFSARR